MSAAASGSASERRSWPPRMASSRAESNWSRGMCHASPCRAAAAPEAMWQVATEVFAFDGLVQNPDRRFHNPNLFTRGNDIYVFDHELAFSFLLDILESATPWRLDGQRYLEDHVFYRKLKGRPIDINGFTARLTALPGPALDGILADAPTEWNNESLAKIERHLRTVSAHATEFAEEVRRRLA